MKGLGKILSMALLFILLATTPAPAQAAALKFKDVTPQYWAADTIDWSIRRGLITGYTDGRFRPNTELTESQFASIFVRYLAPCYIEFGQPAPVKQAYYYLNDEGIRLPGAKNSRLQAKPITRLTMARAIFEANGGAGSDREVIDWMYEQGLTSGKGISSNQFTDFGGNDHLQRVQAIRFFERLSEENIFPEAGYDDKTNYQSCLSDTFIGNPPVPMLDFNYIDQNRHHISLSSLKGKVWLAQLNFTRSTTVGPPMIANTAEVQLYLEDQGIKNYKMVVFSVDPSTDTPEVLRDHLSAFDVPVPEKWHLLTGYTQNEISKLAVQSLRLPVINDPNSDQVIMGSRLCLVNQKGQVVNSYPGHEYVPFSLILRDMKLLLKEKK